MTRTADAPLGASLSLEGGVPGEVEEAGCPLGTTMVVRDLFYNTPARLKFMKKDSAEGAAVFAVVQRVALSHPEVAVKSSGTESRSWPPPGTDSCAPPSTRCWAGIWPWASPRWTARTRACPCPASSPSPPGCRASRNWQFFFVNGRQVKSRLMMAALEEAYQNQKMVGKFPGCVSI